MLVKGCATPEGAPVAVFSLKQPVDSALVDYEVDILPGEGCLGIGVEKYCQFVYYITDLEAGQFCYFPDLHQAMTLENIVC